MNKHITIERWKEITDSVLYILEVEHQIEQHEAIEIISALSNKENELISLKLTPESLEIFKRASHLDATHVGSSALNPSFYIQLDGMDFCLDTKLKSWVKCDWDSKDMDNCVTYTRIKFK